MIWDSRCSLSERRNRVATPSVRKPSTAPLWANSHRPEANGWAPESSTGAGAVAPRTTAIAAPLATTPLKLSKDRSAQIDRADLWTAGSGRRSRSYQPTPNPSAFTVPDAWSRGAYAWWWRECGGSTKSASNVIGGPR